MIIKKLEIQGFKSFADRIKVVFHPGITAIIGPNGTGKSNVVDALLWVLGGKSSKSLRGERSGDVIFNGNNQRAPMGLADVNLYLSEEEEELIINHRVFRSGESEYRLDGKAVRLKDIQDILWEKAIAETDYFVIEQGSIGTFLSSKPLEKRQLLEEAAGTAFYKDKKRQAENKLANSEQNLTRLEDILSEVTREKNSLQRQAQAAIRYRKIREEIRQLTLYHYRKKISQLEASQGETSKTYHARLSDENDFVYTIKTDEKKLAETRQELWDLENINKNKKEELYTLRSKAAKLESDRDKEEKRIDFFQDKKESAEESKKEYRQELNALKQEIQDKQTGLQNLEQILNTKEKELQQAEIRTQKVRNKLDLNKNNIESIRNQILGDLSQHTEIRNESAKAEKELELLIRQEEKIRRQAEDEHFRMLKTKQQIKELTSDIEIEKKDVEITKKGLDKLKNDIKRLSESQVKITEQLEKLKNEKEKNLHHLHSLEKLEEKERETLSESITPETMGILADLIDIDALHAPLVDIIWKEEAKAVLIEPSHLLQVLDENEVKGDFLLIPSPELKEASVKFPDDPRIIGFLKAQIKPEERLKNRTQRLQEAALVKDIRTAVELWINHPGCNFLTLNGDLVLASGLVKIGQKKEGLFSIHQDIKDIKTTISSLEKQIIPLEEQNKDLDDKLAELEQEAAALSDTLSHKEKAVESKVRELEFVRLEEKKTALAKDLAEKEAAALDDEKQKLQQKSKQLHDQISSLAQSEKEKQNELEKLEKELIQLEATHERENKKFFELKSAIDLDREKITNTRDRTRTLSERHSSITEKLESLNKDIQTAAEQLQSLSDSIERLKQKEVSIEKEIKVKEKDLMESEVNYRRILDLQKKLEDKLEQKRTELNEKKEERVQWEVKKAQKERDLVNLEESCWQELKKTIQEIKSEIDLDSIPDENIEAILEEAKDKLQKFKAVNLMAEEEYEVQKKRHDFLTQQYEDLRQSIDATKEAIRKIDQESKTQFLGALGEVNKNFMDVFSILFEGGHAEIKLSEPNLPLESGIEIIAQPPGKRVQSLNLLSGGEKTLTSLSFFFALFRYKPTPFCILDEVDAALDEANLGRFLKLMNKIKTHTQFIIITHNFKTMEVADYIYGTTMAEPNVTSIYAVQLDKVKGALSANETPKDT